MAATEEGSGPTRSQSPDVWANGDAYKPYVGRWSRLVAREFPRLAGAAAGRALARCRLRHGRLIQAILEVTDPGSVTGIDASEGYVAYARAHTPDPRATFAVGDAQRLEFGTATFDAAVSGLVLNFVPTPRGWWRRWRGWCAPAGRWRSMSGITRARCN